VAGLRDKDFQLGMDLDNEGDNLRAVNAAHRHREDMSPEEIEYGEEESEGESEGEGEKES